MSFSFYAICTLSFRINQFPDNVSFTYSIQAGALLEWNKFYIIPPAYQPYRQRPPKTPHLTLSHRCHHQDIRLLWQHEQSLQFRECRMEQGCQWTSIYPSNRLALRELAHWTGPVAPQSVSGIKHESRPTAFDWSI